MSARSSPSRGSPHPPGSSSPRSRANRGTVIVEQSLLSVKTPPPEDFSQRKSTGSIAFSPDSTPRHPLHRKSTGSFGHSDLRDSHHSSPEPTTLLSPPNSFRISNDSLSQISPPGSTRSSVSSLVDVSSSVSNLAVVTSTEDRLLDELKRQIAHGAQRIQQLEKQVESIPLLTVKADELERERGKLANDLLDSQEVVHSMKQRLSLLHEQNNQLVKLTHSSGGGSSELLRNRNALVASLTQIKKLQERVDGIPSLKAQLRSLTEDNTKLKEKELELSKKFPDQLPSGVTRASYQTLVEENGKLTETNKKLSEEVRVAGERLASLSTSLEGMKKRMDKFESTRSIVVPLQQKVKKLEKEKDELYQEYVEVKFHQQPSMDIDTAHLVSQVASLQKKNSHLQAKLEQSTIDARQEKEKLVLKLFELESLNMNSQKFDLETRILDGEGSSKTPAVSSNHIGKTHGESVDDEMSGLPAESKVQMLKLQQLRVHSEQSRNMLQSLMAERDHLENKVVELTRVIETRDIGDLEKCLEEKEHKLELARESIAKLEKELQIANSITAEQSTAEAANKELTKEVERLRENQSNYEELVTTQAQAKQCVEERDSLLLSLQKAKDDKHRAERRYREGKSRLRSLAKELSSSVELIQKYQTQCMKLQEQLDWTERDMRTVRSMSASYKAKLEMAEVESSAKDDGIDGKDGEGMGAAAYEKVCQERDGLKETVESLGKTLSEQQANLWKIKEERKGAESANKEVSQKLSDANKQVEEVTWQLDVAKQQLEKEQASAQSVKTELDSLKSSHTKLSVDHKELSERTVSLETELDKAREAVSELTRAKSELDKAREAVSELTRAKSELDKAREAVSELTRAKSELDHTLSELRETRSTSEAERVRLSQELGTSRENCDELQKQLAKKEECLEQEISQKKQLEEELSEMKTLVGTLSSQLDTVNEEMEALSTKHRQSQEELRTLKEAKSSQDANRLREVIKEKEKLETELKEVRESTRGVHSLKIALEEAASQREAEHKYALSGKAREIKELEKTVISLRDEVEGYKGTIRSLQRHVDEAETREVEHERLKQNFKQLEKALGTSSHDNKALFSILQQTLKELPSYSSDASRSLQDENLRLEEQISVLSQWNDKQRSEIETLESTLERLEIEKEQLFDEIQAKASFEQENVMLKRELKEVEMEVGNLRRQARSELQEEFKVKMETQSQLLTMFNQHNTSLQKQVTDLTSHVHDLGGTLERDKPVSPPPMPDVALSIPRGDEIRQRTVSDLERENYILKERIGTTEKELLNLQSVSSQFRRRSSSLRAMFSVPVGPINEELQVNVPPELLLPCSLLSDYITEHSTTQGSLAEGWVENISSEWFACMAQRTLTPACAQCYISTLSRLSTKLLDVVINLQDEKGNTALHYAVANGNFPVAAQFIRLRCCNTTLMNKAGYNPLMLAAACCVEVGDHRDVMGHLIDRGGVNRVAEKDQRTALMLAACSGSKEMVIQFLEKGADINLRDKDGSTALMFAAQSGHIEIVQFLLSQPHIEHSVKDNDGLTALDIAKEAGFSDIATLLSKTSKSKFKR